MKKTFFIVFLLLFLISKGGKAQTYFNERYDFQSGPDVMYHVVLHEGKYIVFGTSRDSNWNNQKLSILSLNNDGSVNFEKHFQENNAEIYPGYTEGTVFLNNHFYVSGSYIASDTFYVKGFLIKTDASLNDTIWRVFIDKPDTLCYSLAVLEKDDHLYLASNCGDKATYNYQIFLTKIDTSGNIVWEKEFGSSYTERLFHMHHTHDGGFMFSGQIYTSNWLPIIIKIDSLGNFQWQKIYGSPISSADYRANVTLTSDGGYAVAYWHNSGNGGGRIRLLKLDANGNTQWDKFYLSNFYSSGGDFGGNVVKIEQLNDGSFLMVTPEFNFSGLLKVDANGDSLWFRKYRNVNIIEDPSLPAQNYLFDFIVDPLDNNAIVCAGFVVPIPPADSGTQDIWVIKLDSLGCPFAGCDTIGQNDTGIDQILVSDINIVVFPNPTTEYFNLQLLLSKPNQEGIVVTLYDINGRESLNQRIITSETFINERVSISHLPKGLYLLKVDNGKRVITKKVVKF